METVIAVACSITSYIMGAWIGWGIHKDFGSRRDKLRYYRMGLKNGIFVRAKVVMRQIRREKKEAK